MLNSVLGDLPALIASYGYGLILVMLESLGLPLPGEATLITASIYAGATHDLTLTGIIAAAVAGAVISDRRPAINSAAPSSQRKAAPKDSTISSMAKGPIYTQFRTVRPVSYLMLAYSSSAVALADRFGLS